MFDRNRIESVWLAHPLRYEPSLTARGYNPIMRNAVNRVLSVRNNLLPTQRMIRITDDNLFAVMMGSMPVLRSPGPPRSLPTSADTPIASPSPTTAWSTSMVNTCAFAGETTRTATSTRSCH